jgi:hypothetical protein
LRSALLALACARTVPTPDAPPDAPPPPALVPADAVRADAEFLYDTLQSAHYDLFARRDRASYDAAYEALIAGIDGPMPRLEAARRLTAFVAWGRVGHARIEFPVPEYIQYVTTGGTVLPFDVQVVDERVLIAHSYSPDIPTGAELLTLDEATGAQWIETLGAYVSAEDDYLRDAQLEVQFPRLHWLHGATAASHRLELRVDGEVRALTIDSAPALEVETAKSEWEARGRVREAEVLDGDIGYLRPGPFYALSGEETLEDVVAFIDAAFEGFIERGVRAAILDLRDNPGGDNSFSDPMIAWVADAPFSFASTYRLRASPTTRGVLEGLAAADPDGTSAAMLAAMQERADGEDFPFPIPEVPPREGGFDGEVWALVNRHSYSNAASVAAILKDNGFAQIAGEETADRPTSYASSAQFTLPELALTVTYPKGWFARPSGEDTGRGVIPDLPLPRPAPGEEGDPSLDALLAHLRGDTPPATPAR